MHLRQLHRLSAEQHGLLRRAQLTDLGLSRHQIRNHVDRGRLERVAPTVFRLRGTPNTLAQRRLLVVLDAGPGAVLSHLTAARMWGLQRRSEGTPHAMRRRDEVHRHSPYVGVVHTTRRLADDHVVRLDGLPVTTPARTIVDLANTHPLGRVARMLDTAWGHRLLTIGELAGVLSEVRSRGRRGVRVLDHLIAERLGHRAPESGLEVRFEQILQRNGLSAMARQVDLAGTDGWICRADFAQVDERLAGFVDSDTYHRALLDRRHDDAQTRRLRAAGYRVFRVSDAQILYDAPAVARAVRAAA